MATTSLQTNLIIRLKEEDFQALEGIAEHIHIPVKDLVHGIISYALDQYSKSKPPPSTAPPPDLNQTIKEKNMNTITHSIKTPSLTEFDLAPYTGKAIQYICLDEQDLSKLSNQGFIHTTHSPIIKLEQTTPLLLYVRMFHQTKKQRLPSMR